MSDLFNIIKIYNGASNDFTRFWYLFQSNYILIYNKRKGFLSIFFGHVSKESCSFDYKSKHITHLIMNYYFFCFTLLTIYSPSQILIHL